MIKEAIGYGSTIDEAKENAIASLNAKEEDDVQFEVLAFPKKKTLGLFGGSKAEVRVFIEVKDEKPKFEKKPVSENKNAPVKKTAPAPKADKPQNAPQKNEAPKVTDKKEEPKSQPTQEKRHEHVEPVYEPAVDSSEIPADSQAGKAVSYLSSILKGLGCTNVSMKVAVRENAARIDLEGEGLGVVIGRRGETLDSLQYLTSLATNNGGGYYKVTLNIGNYREKRETTLISLATKVSEQVLATGRNRSLEPMNPYERRIIHTTVQGINGVVSNSFGDGTNRRVVISVEGSDPRPPRRDNRRQGFQNKPRRPRNDDFKKQDTEEKREPKKDSDIPLYGKIN